MCAKSTPQENARNTIVPPKKPIKLGVLLSGTGRTFQNLHHRIADGSLEAEIACVISSRHGACGVQRARDAGVPVHVVSRRDLRDPDFHQRITEHLAQARVDLVCLAGFNTLYEIPPVLAGKVINIHPALLPEFGGRGFYGLRVHEAVLAAGKRESGCTVHFCDNQYDHGPIILQRRVPILDDDTPQSLAARVFEQECIAYPQAIRLLASRRERA